MRDLDSVLRDLSHAFLHLELDGKVPTIDSRTPEGDTPLHLAAHYGDSEAIGILVAAGADINAIGDMGYTPLHYAVASEFVGSVDALLKLGASPSILNEFEKSPETNAQQTGIRELFALFGNHAV
jgi:ankyrin repeat protein